MDISTIPDVSQQFVRASDRISCLALGIKEVGASAPDTVALYKDMLVDEVKHVQLLALELTRLVMGDARSDDSVFAEGELSSANKKRGEGANAT
ncbi:MAG: hypothetical protein LUE21_08785 [Oscillospiraceae bacterium]|nr:hypothetical protein [Oscillospiraceae bacterium]